MAALDIASYGDLVNAVKKDYGPPKIQQIAQNYVSYPIFQLFFKKERMEHEGGQLIQRNLHLKKSTRFRFKGIAQSDQIKIEDLTAQAQIPWRFADTHWAFVDQDVLLAQSSEHKIFKLIDVRRNDAYLDAVEGLEATLLTAPSTTDTKTPYGIPYYVVKNATTGHTGTVPGNHTTVAGISPTTYPNWRNYAGLYTSVSKSDLIAKLRDAFFYCDFQNPEMLTVTDYRKNRDKFVLLTNRSVGSDLEELAEAQNENLGQDVASQSVNSNGRNIYMVDGVVTVRRKPIIQSQYLDSDTSNPVYGLSTDYWCMYVHEEMNFKEGKVREVADTHGAYYTPVDLWCNLLCLDRRRNFVLATSAS